MLKVRNTDDYSSHSDISAARQILEMYFISRNVGMCCGSAANIIITGLCYLHKNHIADRFNAPTRSLVALFRLPY